MRKDLNCFVVADPNKCIGCKACEVACFSVHNSNNHVSFTVGTITTPVIPRLYLVREENFAMPIQCRQCEDAPCANSCPVGAIKQENKVISIDEKVCIGCKTCLLACPFGAIDLLPEYDKGESVMQSGLEEERKIAYKCDLCQGRDNQACIQACPQDALSIVRPMKEKKAKNIKAALGLLETVKNV